MLDDQIKGEKPDASRSTKSKSDSTFSEHALMQYSSFAGCPQRSQALSALLIFSAA
jgi:hypothetical protein